MLAAALIFSRLRLDTPYLRGSFGWMLLLSRHFPCATASRAVLERHSLARTGRSPLVTRNVASSHKEAHSDSARHETHQPLQPSASPGSTLYTPALAPGSAATTSRDEPSCIATLLVSCPDQKGVIAAVAQLLFGFGCNVVRTISITLVFPNCPSAHAWPMAPSLTWTSHHFHGHSLRRCLPINSPSMIPTCSSRGSCLITLSASSGQETQVCDI